MCESNDAEIRAAFHKQRLCYSHSLDDALVIDELGIMHGKARVDIAVINGSIHGYEIKSSMDTLKRLPRQMAAYDSCFQNVTVVSSEKHAKCVLKSIPNWWGIVEATKGKRGGISFQTIRRSQKNLNVDLFNVAHLLWRDEAIEILTRKDVSRRTLNVPRKDLYNMLAESLSLGELISLIKQFMSERNNWRHLRRHG